MLNFLANCAKTIKSKTLLFSQSINSNITFVSFLKRFHELTIISKCGTNLSKPLALNLVGNSLVLFTSLRNTAFLYPSRRRLRGAWMQILCTSGEDDPTTHPQNHLYTSESFTCRSACKTKVWSVFYQQLRVWNSGESEGKRPPARGLLYLQDL